MLQTECLLVVLAFCATVDALSTGPAQAPFASGIHLNPYPGKKRLTFREDGTFKLTVFSDLHFGENPGDGLGRVKDANSTRAMRVILTDEEPDYVAINGDLITGDFTFRENSTYLIDQILAPLIAAQVPFSCSHGNHDNHINITHLEEILREQQIAPLSYTRSAPPDVGGVAGPGNYWVPIYAKQSDPAPALVLWFFDSRGGVARDGTPLPDWVDASVARWIAQETAVMDAAWGPASARSAIAFVHIPPHAIQAVQPTIDKRRNPGLDDDNLGGGSVQDSIFDPPSKNARDTPFWDALNRHVVNLHAVISGHAHGNEWCAREPAKGVVFCFNKHSGYGGYDSPGWGHGVRNLVLASPDPRGTVETWIRLESGETRARVLLREGHIST